MRSPPRVLYRPGRPRYSPIPIYAVHVAATIVDAVVNRLHQSKLLV
jgi:hypothetical protein